MATLFKDSTKFVSGMSYSKLRKLRISKTKNKFKVFYLIEHILSLGRKLNAYPSMQ